MKYHELDPSPTEKIEFHLSRYKFIPRKAGCYVLSSLDGHILYIGQSKDLYRRFQQHLEDSEKTGPTLEGRVYLFHYILYEELNLFTLERTWLNQFSAAHGVIPILNKVDSPVA